MGDPLRGRAKFCETEPTRIGDDGTRTALTGGRDFVIAFSPAAGGRPDRVDHPGERGVTRLSPHGCEDASASGRLTT